MANRPAPPRRTRRNWVREAKSSAASSPKNQDFESLVILESWSYLWLFIKTLFLQQETRCDSICAFVSLEPPCLVNDTPLTANLHSLLGVSQGSGHPEISILTALESRKPSARSSRGIYRCASVCVCVFVPFYSFASRANHV